MKEPITLAIVGSGGAGVIVTGEMCLQAVAYAGGYGHLRKSFGPQIRGGESAAVLTLSDTPLDNIGEQCQWLFVLDWKNFDRFKDEIVLIDSPQVYVDELAGPCPDSLQEIEESFTTVPFSGCAKRNNSEKNNSVFLGFIGYLLGLDSAHVTKAIEKRFSKKHAEFIALAYENMSAGYRYGEDVYNTAAPSRNLAQFEQEPSESKQWMLTGNEGVAYGALKAGVRFVAAYPITPATDVLEWVAGHIEALGGHLVQAEDELSAVNMIIGASYGGVPSMTATSGPGLALMSEALGLAIASETPIVVIDVMRGGPSTGIPTKSEQSDFNLAVYGLHGDAPHVVVAPSSISDTVLTAGWAVALAEALQTVVIVLSDQRIGQSIEVLPAPKECRLAAKRQTRSAKGSESSDPKNYLRYLDTDTGISDMALPGDDGGIYTAEGLEHNTKGTPSPRNEDHFQQLEKRQRKLANFDFGAEVSEIHLTTDSSECLLICWGSTTASVREAAKMLFTQGVSADVLSLRLLSPLPLENIKSYLPNKKQVFVVEQNHQGQFYRYLRSHWEGFCPLLSIARPGPVSISANEVVAHVLDTH